ncbi:MAG: hypothetical protein IPM95_06980 [Sphingobacteriales bacterium]|nr:hypothetical protein [Sphingobacteriales bacterium]
MSRSQSEIIAIVESLETALSEDIILLKQRQLQVFQYFQQFLLDKYQAGNEWQPMTAAILTRYVFSCYTSFNTTGEDFITDNETALIKTLAIFDTYYDYISVTYNNTGGNILPCAAFMAAFAISSNCTWINDGNTEPVVNFSAEDFSVLTADENGGDGQYIGVGYCNISEHVTIDPGYSYSVNITQPPAHGSIVTTLPNGDFIYNTDPDYLLNDEVKYTITVNGNTSPEYTITIEGAA